MGEAAEMMLDGTLCECCGTYIGDGEGFPGYCSAECAKGRGAESEAAPDEDCVAYLNDLEVRERQHAVDYLRIFMGVGKKRAKKLVAQWRASQSEGVQSHNTTAEAQTLAQPVNRGK